MKRGRRATICSSFFVKRNSGDDDFSIQNNHEGKRNKKVDGRK